MPDTSGRTPSESVVKVTVEVAEQDRCDSWAYSDDDAVAVVTFVVIGPREHVLDRENYSLDLEAPCSFSSKTLDVQEVPYA